MTGALKLDRRTRLLDGGRVVVGGDPTRILRLTPSGAEALHALISPAAPGVSVPASATAAVSALARRLTDAGIAHPSPTETPADQVTVVIPVRDRPEELHRCLSAAGTDRMIVVDDGSLDPGVVAQVCARHGARLVVRPVSGGPAAARNAALPFVHTDLVAFLDSDCIPEPRWLERLCGVLDDPEVAAAAPRILPAQPGAAAGVVARFAAARSPLDLGDQPGAVNPGRRLSYVPTAALLLRRAAVGAGFDPDLRYGEDVDLIWRMRDAGHRVRYVPDAVVRHPEPTRLRALLTRRFAYGTSAGPLARRHPGRLAPLVIHPWPAGVVAVTVSGTRRSSAAALAAYVGVTLRSLRRAGLDTRTASQLAVRGLEATTTATGRAATMIVSPLLALGLRRRRTRLAAIGLLIADPLRSWVRLRPPLDPVRWTALAIADDIAYGAGVWTGAARATTILPLIPRIARRNNTLGGGSYEARIR